MKIRNTEIEGCYIIEALILKDQRGSFHKPYHRFEFQKIGIDLLIKEEYYSTSKKNILRGLHFQLPPKATAKLITCLSGRVFDCVVDLRQNSSTYMKTYSLELTDNNILLYIPEGLAHGFCSLEDDSTLLYMSSEVFSSDHDSGIKWDSVNVDWPIQNPIVSERDENLVPFNKFNNPF